MRKRNSFLAIPVIIFLLLTLPFLNVLPYMDGNIDFVQTINFQNGGITEYFSSWNTVHPPLKLLISYFFYSLLGISAISYSLPGILIGVVGIAAIYFLTKTISTSKAAMITALVFSLHPLFISNSIFYMRDQLLTVLLITSLLFYAKRKFLAYATFCSLAIMTKETAMLLPVSVLAAEIILLAIRRKFVIKDLLSKLLLLFPFLVYLLWKLYLDSNQKSSWNEWIFTDNKSGSAIGTVINNLISLEFLNPYAFQHWKQLFFLNFNWVLVLVSIMVFILIASKTKFSFLKSSENKGVILTMIFFSLAYFFTVLTIQTYTIPRYALPLIPFIVISFGISVSLIKNRFLSQGLVFACISIIIISLFTSVDPLARKIWGLQEIFGQTIYSTNEHLAGNDGITYNIQYLLISKERSDLIRKGNEQGLIFSKYCRWIFPDPNNETKMLSELNLSPSIPCYQIDNANR
jgi:4-amino-4-deoxy-L-arabinose transferase-like glycosyltransferase